MDLLHRSAMLQYQDHPPLMAHRYILGQSGTGKSTLQKQFIHDAIRSGAGVFYLDPHGHDTDELLQHIPKQRRRDVILFDPSREETLSFNPLEDTDNIPLSVSILLDTIKEAWGYNIPTPTMDMVLYFSLALLAENNKTLSELPKLLTMAHYRAKLKSKDPVVRQFWMSFEAMTPKEQRDMVSSTLNKALLLVANPAIRKMLSYNKSSFSITEAVSNKIILARLPQGKLAKGRTALLGSVLLSLIHQACLDRDTTVPFHVVLDEAHLWAPTVIEEMMSGIRKFNVTVTVSHQYINQMNSDTFSAIVGNASEMYIFRTSMEDAEILERRFGTNNMDFSFDKLPNFKARQFPFDSRTPMLTVTRQDQSPYPKSLSDILDNHRLKYWR